MPDAPSDATPIAVWHVLARRAPLRRTDLGRRTLLRTAGLLAAAGGLYAVVDVRCG